MAALALVAIAVLAAFQVRGLGGPRLIRMPLGALPDQTALTYDSAASTLSAVDDAGAAARAPVSLALSIAVDGTRVVVGTENGVLLSEDGGRTLMPVLRDIHIWAVALSGADAAAVSWGRSLYVSHDGGRGWRPASAPRADLQINALLITSSVWLAAAQIGVLVSHDQGESWVLAAGSPERATSLLEDGGGLLLGTWNGDLYRSSERAASWQLVRAYPSGIWSLAAGGLVGTANGLFQAGRRVAGPLGQTETVSVAVSGGTRFAATPGSRVWADAGDGWHQVLAGVRW